MRIDVPMRWWINTCPGPVMADTKEDCLKFIQSVVGDYELDEIQACLKRLGYIPQYRQKPDGSFWCVGLPDKDWKRK